MQKILNFGVSFGISDWKVWRAIGQEAQTDLVQITFSSTPYTSAEDTINQHTMRGGLAYRQGGELKQFPPTVITQLKDLLLQFNRWFLMFGMVALLDAPDAHPFYCVVPEPKSGYFVARINKDHQVEVGWRFHEQDQIGTAMVEKRPSPRAKVFIWPAHQPDLTLGQPFRSRLAVLLQPHAMIDEMRENVLSHRYLGAHPPLIVATRSEGNINFSMNGANATPIDMKANAAEATRMGRTERAQFAIQRVRDQQITEVEYEEKIGGSHDPSVSRVGYSSDGQRLVVRRGNLWASRIPLRIGTALERPPQPTGNDNWVDDERFFIEVIYRALGVPMRSGSASHRRNAQGGAETTMSQDDMGQLRQTVMGTRANLVDAFVFMYRHFMSETSLSAAREHRDRVIESMDIKIRTLKEYIGYLQETDQLETEPMYAARRDQEETQAAKERERAISEQTAKIVNEAHRRGKLLDQQVVMGHLGDVYDLQRQREELREKLERDVEGMQDIQLEFVHPPLMDIGQAVQMAREGFFNPEELAKLASVSMGMSPEASKSAFAGADMIPPLRKYELEIQRQQQKDQLKLDREKLELEKEKEKNNVQIQREAQKQQAEQKAEGGEGSGGGEKRKASEETKPAKTSKKKK